MREEGRARRAFFAGGAFVGLYASLPVSSLAQKGAALMGLASTEPRIVGKSSAQLIAEAREKSSNIKGLYMTADVANDAGAGATRLRERIIRIADETEINGIVIDVKEVCGPDYNEERLRRLIDELKARGIWTIARIAAFKDASQIEAHPEWYLTRKNSKTVGGECNRKRHLVVKNAKLQASNTESQTAKDIFWRDKRGGYWLDPASAQARAYLLDFSKRMIDMGFDELQYDYIRFPSDGDVDAAIYPVWDKSMSKHEVLRSFFTFLRDGLKTHKPDIILSADLFGYVAAQGEDASIGQRLEDIGDAFDYISPMVYPSHYYSGFYTASDIGRGLKDVNYTFAQARANPNVVVERSLFFARDFLDGRLATSSRATTSPVGVRPSSVRLRPWLEDFFHDEDRAAGRPHGVDKIRMQIEAAERVEDHGWLLWNASNIYTEGALNPVLEKR